MSRKYKNPPIIEAVCEFRLTPDTKWDLTIPGLMYEKLQGQFPKKEQRLMQEVGMSHGPEGVKQLIRPVERMLFLTEDGKKFIQAGSNLLAVNYLAPYQSWDILRPSIEMAFEILSEILDIGVLQKIGLRYINKIEIPQKPVKLEDYFEFYPFHGERLPQNIGTFRVGSIFSFADNRDACKVELTTAAPDDPDNLAFLLDLDYTLAKPQAVKSEFALEWIEEAHQRIEEIFEGCINNRLREIFQEVK